MSQGEPASGSLEDILSNIRKSLAEQSTDVLVEPFEATQAAEARGAARKDGLVGRLANATAGLPDRASQEDDLSDVLEAGGDLPKIATPAATAAPAQAEPAAAVQPVAASADPLWFLTRKEADAAGAGAGAVRAGGDSAPLTQPEALRAILPPFFGASAQGPQVETAPAVPQATAAGQPAAGSRASPERDFGRVLDPAIAREVSLVAAAAETAGRRVSPGAPLARPGGAGTEVPHALESMVLELLKPMMRQWLDQNMPRLVAAALKEEADRAAGGESSSGKP
jgi:cell pole-organizing protein PopZ